MLVNEILAITESDFQESFLIGVGGLAVIGSMTAVAIKNLKRPFGAPSEDPKYSENEDTVFPRSWK